MLNKLSVVAIVLSVICGSLALDTNFSPVLLFQSKGNALAIEKTTFSSTTKIGQRVFEKHIESLGERRTVFCVTSDLSPEDLAAKDEQGDRAFKNIAESNILDYIPFVENAVDNKVTKGQNVAHASVSTSNDLEPTPDTNAKVIVVKLPERHSSESKFHYLARLDRALFALISSEEYKDAIFVLSSEMNSRLEQHSRQRRATAGEGIVERTPNALIYFKEFIERKKTGTDSAITMAKPVVTKVNDNEITVNFDGTYKIALTFVNDPTTLYWSLDNAKSTVNGQPAKLATEIEAPSSFSFSCSSSVFFAIDNNSDVAGVYFKDLQIQFDFAQTGTDGIAKFTDSYDCVGFTSPAIWTGLFVVFLLLAIMSFGIIYIMDIRTMDRFDDPKGKTITVSNNE